MAAGAPSLHHIRSQLDAVLKKDPAAAALAIRSPSRGAWPTEVEHDGRRFQLRWCASPLEIREALTEDRADGVIILTDLQETDLASDILARLARGRLMAIESWRMLREAFQARQVDTRLRGCDWLADLLLDQQPADGYPPVPGGTLDADTAWRTLLSTCIGIDTIRPDSDTLLHWTMENDGLYRFAQLPEPARQGIAAHLREVCGPAGALIVDTVIAGNGSDAVAIGLACEVVFRDGWTSTAELLSAAVRLEALVGRAQIAAPAARQWAEAAIRTVRRLSPPPREIFQQAEDILKSIHAFACVISSTILPAAFDARLAAAAAAIDHALAGGALLTAEQAGRQVFEHQQAAWQRVRGERLRMGLRLLRWLAQAEDTLPTQFDELALGYVADGGYVDWARGALIGGDDLAPVSSVLVRLAGEARRRREQQNHAFAQAFQLWNGQAGVVRSLTPIETVLDHVVVEAAAKAPVLLLVLDGLSFPIFRQLLADLSRDGWNELAIGGAALHAGVSTVPTVTEIARASLLCGRLRQGVASAEKEGFAAHPGLNRVSRNHLPPVLFHKGALNDGGVLADTIRTALGDARQRVVGIVYNAVDDHLSGADQARPRWSLDDLQLVRPILHEAKNAGRLVIVTADHGHVLEDGSRQIAKGTGDRWRPLDTAVDGEIAFTGARVLTPDGQNTALVPWSEQARYGTKKVGYHGGVSPQEALVPLAVFSAAADAPLWDFALPTLPDWWEAPLAPLPEAQPAIPTPPRRRRAAKAPTTEQTTLFDAVPPTSKADTPVADWIATLITSDAYAAQCKLAGRGAPKDEDVRTVLAALDKRGRLPRVALAKQIGVPLFRLNGFLSLIRRVINLDQTPILTVDEAGDWVELDVKLLASQFEIKV